MANKSVLLHLLLLACRILAQSVASTTSPSFRFTNSSIAATTTSNAWPIFSIPPGFNGTVAANGTGPQYASSCAAAYKSWSSYIWDNQPSAVTSTFVGTYVDTITTTSIITANYSILCDGLTRFDNTDIATEVTLSTPTLSTYTYTSTHYSSPPFSTPPMPSCSINNDDCLSLSTAWYSSITQDHLSFYAKNVLTISLASPPVSIVVNGQPTAFPSPMITPPVLTLHGQTYPPLPGSKVAYFISNATDFQAEMTLTPGGTMTPTWDVDDLYTWPVGKNLPCYPTSQLSTSVDLSACAATAACTIYANEVQVMYFAAPKTSSDICANTSPGWNRDDVSLYSQPHASTLINGSTYWSDSVYLRYSTIWANRVCGNSVVTLGNKYSTATIALASTDLSTLCSFQFTEVVAHLITLGATPYPFNFNDLTGAVPNSAYQCAFTCQGLCSTIVQDQYNPNLAVPLKLRDTDPQWADCGVFLGGSYDPPTALNSIEVVADPTTSVQIPGPTAQPVSTPPPGPASTRTPGITARPPDPSSQRPQPTGGAPPGQSSPGDPRQSSDPGDPKQSSDPGDPSQSQSHAGDPPSGSSRTGDGPSGPSASSVIVVVPPGATTSQTLHPGDPFGPSATVVSVDPTSGIIVVSGPSGTSTIMVPSAIPVSDPSQVAVATVGGETVFADPASPGLVTIGGATLTLSPGLSTVVDGMTVTEGPGGLTMVDGQTTVLLPVTGVATGSSSQYVVSGLTPHGSEPTGGPGITNTGRVSSGGVTLTGGNTPQYTSMAASNGRWQAWVMAVWISGIWGFVLW